MKLLLISRDFPNIFGGVSDYTYHLSKALAEKGMKVYVLTSKDKRVIKEDYDIKGMGCVKVLPVVERWSFLGVLQIIRGIRKINPHCVLLQYVPHMYNKYGIPIYIAIFSILLSIKRFKLITTFHEVAIRFNIKKPKYWIIAIIQRIIAYILCICSKKIIVSIEYYRKMLNPFFKKIIIIPVSSNILPINLNEKEKTNFRDRIAPNGEFIIVTFGSGAPWRRNDILLEASKKIINDLSYSLKIVFLGRMGNSPQGNLIKSLSQKYGINKNVILPGYLEGDEIYKYLVISDLFVLLDSDAYGGVSTKSTALTSAYAAGLPILANKGILTDNFLKHKKNIFLIDNLDVDAVIQAIIELINNRQLLNNLKKGSINTYRNYLTWDEIANKYKATLNKIY